MEASNQQKTELTALDVVESLNRLRGNTELYLKLLKMFVDGQSDFEQQYRSALAGEDASVPVRLAHTLKGLAGNIGATQLQALARNLETSTETQSDQIESVLQQLLAELQHVLSDINFALAQGDSIFVEARESMAQSFPVLVQLAEALRDSDVRSADLVADLRPVFKDKPEFAQFSLIHTAIDNFDFEGALAQLYRFGIQLGLDLKAP